MDEADEGKVSEVSEVNYGDESWRYGVRSDRTLAIGQ